MNFFDIGRHWKSTLRFLAHPIIAGLLFTLVFSFWHVGAFYEAAIRDKTLHMAEHLSMFFVPCLCGGLFVLHPSGFRAWHLAPNALHSSPNARTNSYLCHPYIF